MSCERNFCPELCDEPDSSSMKYEDFISEDAASLKAWARPLPRRHLMAVGATICVAGTLFFALPDAQDLTLASKEAPDNRTLLQDTGSLSLDESGTLIDTPSSPVPAEESATLLAGTLRNAPAEDSALSSALSASREAAPDADAKVPAPARDVTILEEIIDPRVELTDAIASLTGPQGSESGAISPDNAEALITADAKAENLDNFEDTVPEDLLADSDSAMNDKLKALDTALNGKEEVQAKWYVEDIHRGDTISSLFSDFNIPWDVMQAITSHKEASASLTNLRPGNHLSFLIDDNNQLLAFVKQITATEQIRFYRDSPATLDFRVARESLNAHMLSPEEAQALAQNPPAVEEPAYKKRGRLVVVTVGKIRSGTQFNIVSDTAVMEGTVRTYRRENRDLAEGSIRRIAARTAEALGCTIELEYNRIEPPVCNNDLALNETARRAARQVFGEEGLEKVPPATGSEDFSYIMEKIPSSLFVFLGTGDEENGCSCPAHNEKFKVNDSALTAGAAFYAQFAEAYLGSREEGEEK